MDSYTEAKIQNIINEIQNHLSKPILDELVTRFLFEVAISRIKILTTHIGYLESNIEILENTNKSLAVQIENITAENRRLAQIAKY